MIHPIDRSYDRTTTKLIKPKKTLATFPSLRAHGYEFLGENHYIRSGYRVHYSMKDCIGSMFEIHNETWNVWIHILGSVVFAALTLFHVHDTSSDTEQWPILVYLGCVSVCFAFSATYHLMYVQSRELYTVYLQFDFAGILVLIVGAALPMVHYTFYCDGNARSAFQLMAVCVGLFGFVATFMPAFRVDPHLRIAVFGSTIVACCVLPLLYLVMTVGIFDERVKAMLQPVAMVLPTNFSGVFFYASKVPERLSPGKYDIWGSSHQWWHLCVVLSAIVYLQQIFWQQEYRSQFSCPV